MPHQSTGTALPHAQILLVFQSPPASQVAGGRWQVAGGSQNIEAAIRSNFADYTSESGEMMTSAGGDGRFVGKVSRS